MYDMAGRTGLRFSVFVADVCAQPFFLLVLAPHDATKDLIKHRVSLIFDGTLNGFFETERFISLRDNVPVKPPEHVEGDIKNAFNEGAACLSIECYNAAATMFRLCVDLATEPLLPDPEDTTKTQPNRDHRRKLGLRLKWLFENGCLPRELKELASCINEEGDDGAHVGNITKDDAENLLDFATTLLERLITEPEKLKLAEERHLSLGPHHRRPS
jgi:hypothetical protein